MLPKRLFPWLMMASVGGLLGAAIILYGYYPEYVKLSKQPEFMVWLALIIISIALVAFFAVPLWLSVIRLKEYLLGNKLDVIVSNILVLALFLVPSLLRLSSFDPFGVRPLLPQHSIRVFFLLALAFVALVPAWTGIFLIRIAGRRGCIDSTSASDESLQIGPVKNYVKYRQLLQQYLTILGVLVGLLMLDTGALRYAQLAAGMSEDIFPNTLVLVYGLCYTLLIVIVYIPTYLTMIEVGQELRDKIYPLRSVDSLIEDMEKRAKLEELLKLNVSTEQSLRTGVAILVPLFSGLLSALLG